ncbi:PQQ-dependent sugar dehydrogenase [Dyadobacter sp. CY261]|uniref:PQQ-dependent sugar dehydrogenase n=1 Tax=Dyadobacter sp. CY261 TaxID=2907203 RepID=UPI001F28B8F8|nr:PQQ-dependent sugar dehydrogenase [Dyadobacter sp. CY261]MCF0069724.1 PQQ-dependent sugar dehydrogenase [Dyadobacter sp. CY261]
MNRSTLIKKACLLIVGTSLFCWKMISPAVPPAKTASEKPDENRFSKVILSENLNEPMELVVLPDGGVLVAERNGGLLLYDPATSKTEKIQQIPVFSKLEDGLLGIALDPKFSENRWVYLFYSPVGDTPQQYVSRFDFDGKKLDLTSEKVLIKIPTQREECCHSGGSIAFGKDGNLFIATGDNTSPFGSNYYAPLDERPGRTSWDAQRSAGNTNDLRGKILRIHPEADGTYSIPNGNLFDKANPLARPEIYVMGCRNPIRISADPKNGYLYWGDVGQNGEKDSERGPRSWDEWNQAKQVGNFGWPYFAGDNKPYAEYDFAREKAGKFFDPLRPVNHSVNNTGLKELPPAQPAFIWYNYVESDLFPHLGTGGKSPMVGPVFYSDQYKKSDRSFPDYYNGKLFIFEWMRDWINVVTMKPDGSYESIEPFMPKTQFDHPIDMEFGPDGAMYLLEYGTYWFAQNANSRLVRIDYSEGNRPPLAKINASTKVGSAPLTVRFSARGTTDYDPGDKLTYEWSFGDVRGAQPAKSSSEEPVFTFKKPGIYQVKLTVTDQGRKSSSKTMEIKVGNEPPKIAVEWPSNRSFYWPDQTIAYKTKITDKEDQLKGGIDPGRAVVTFEHIPFGEDITLAAQNYESAVGTTRLSAGEKLISESDCKACHGLDKKSIGPAYTEIAKRYKGDAKAVEKLAAKVLSGGNGNWGENAMSAHPQLTLAQTSEMVSYILSLAQPAAKIKSLPLSGTVVTKSTQTEEGAGKYLLTVSYADKGANGIPSLTTRKEILLRPPVLEAISCDTSSKAALNSGSQKEPGKVRFTENNAYIAFKDVDLTTIKTVSLQMLSSGVDGTVTLREGSPDGQVVAKFPIKRSNTPAAIDSEIQKTNGIKTLYFVYNDAKNETGMFNGPLVKAIVFQK